MLLTRRRFVLMTGSALAGAVFVPKYERWFARVAAAPLLDPNEFHRQYVKFALGFSVTHEMLEDDLMYHPKALAGFKDRWDLEISSLISTRRTIFSSVRI